MRNIQSLQSFQATHTAGKGHQLVPQEAKVGEGGQLADIRRQFGDVVVTEKQRRQRGQAEKTGRQTGELVEGEVQVHQMREVGNGGGQSGEEARQRVTSGVVETVPLKEVGKKNVQEGK